jgi:Flp pilus assembly protein TadG
MRGRRRSRGQALVEFALVFPIIALLAFAFIDIGRAVFSYNTLTNSARQGARVAMVSQLDPTSAPWNCAANKPVEDVNSPNWTWKGCAIAAGSAIGVAPGDVSVTYSAPPGTTLSCSPTVNVGCIATVTVVNDFTPITPVAGSLIGAMTFSATSAMPVERIFP